LDRQKLGIVV